MMAHSQRPAEPTLDQACLQPFQGACGRFKSADVHMRTYYTATAPTLTSSGGGPTAPQGPAASRAAWQRLTRRSSSFRPCSARSPTRRGHVYNLETLNTILFRKVSSFWPCSALSPARRGQCMDSNKGNAVI